MADYIEREEVKKEIIEWASIEKNLIEEIKNRRDFWLSKASKYDEIKDEMNTDICDGKAVELEIVMKMIQEQPKKVLVGRGVAMKGEIFFRCTDGTEIPVKEVRGLEGNGVLIIIMAQILRKEDMQKMEQNIETRLGNGMRVIVLDERVKEIMRLEH